MMLSFNVFSGMDEFHVLPIFILKNVLRVTGIVG
jgi:hypothetical protein